MKCTFLFFSFVVFGSILCQQLFYLWHPRNPLNHFQNQNSHQSFGVNVNKHLWTHCSKCKNWFDTCFIANALLHFLTRSPNFMCSAWLHIVVFGFVLFPVFSPFLSTVPSMPFELASYFVTFHRGQSVKCAPDGGPWRMVEGKCIWKTWMKNTDKKTRMTKCWRKMRMTLCANNKIMMRGTELQFWFFSWWQSIFSLVVQEEVKYPSSDFDDHSKNTIVSSNGWRWKYSFRCP